MTKVLIVDDDEAIAEMLAMSLSNHFEVRWFTRAIDGLTAVVQGIADSAPFDFLLLDCAMPHLDAFTFTEVVRKIESTGIVDQPCKIGVFTAFSNTVERSSLVQTSGVDYYWRKPDQIVELPNLISTALHANN